MSKKINNSVINENKRISSNEDDNEDDEDDDTEGNNSEDSKSRKNSECSDSKFSPAMLGLLRVGDHIPKREKKEPVVLNRRGMVLQF